MASKPSPQSLRNPSGLSPLSHDDLREEIVSLAIAPIGKCLRLFPCRFNHSKGKDQLSPSLGGWSDDSNLTNDPGQAGKLWERFKGAAVATRCDDLVVFDIDMLNGPDGPRSIENTWVASLSKDERKALETGLKSTTPSLGQHWIFRASEAWKQSEIQPKNGLFPGVDLIAGPKKIILLPPSFVEKRGKGYCGRYTFGETNIQDTDAPVLPDILLKLIREASNSPDPTPPKDLALLKGALVPEGDRRAFMLKKSRFLRGQGLGLVDLHPALLGIRDHCCEGGSHPFTDEEVWDIATSAVDKFQPDHTDEGGPLRILTAGEFKAIPEPEFVINEVLPPGVTVLFSDPGVGKSFLALAIACSVARDIPLLGYPEFTIRKPGKVLIALPESIASWAARLRAWDAHHFFKDDSPNLHFINDRVNIFSDSGWVLLEDAFGRVAEDEEEIPSLLIIDTLAAASPGANENDVGDMGLIMSRVQGLVARGSNVLLIHHSNKAGAFRGHTSISGSCDAMVKLTKDASNGVLELTAVKLRDAEKIAPCSFEISKTANGAVPVKSAKVGVWSKFDSICKDQPGLREALEAHGLQEKAEDADCSTAPAFSEGVAPRQLIKTWNDASPPDDRAHRGRRQRALLKALRLLAKSKTLIVTAGNINTKETDAMDAILTIPKEP